MTTLNAEFKNAPRLQASLTARVERRALNDLDDETVSRQRFRDPGLRPVGRGSVTFDSTFVPHERLLGEEGRGFAMVMHEFDYTRSLLGLMAMVAAGACYAAARWWPPAILIVNLWLAVNWFGDSLDGTLARLRNRQRPRYGFYVDHIVDALGILAILCGLALSGYMSWVVALAFLVAYFLLCIDVYLATYTIGAFRMAYCQLGPTELRILLAIGNVAVFLHPRTRLLGDHLLMDVAMLISVAVLLVITMVSIARNTLTLYRAERI